MGEHRRKDRRRAVKWEGMRMTSVHRQPPMDSTRLWDLGCIGRQGEQMPDSELLSGVRSRFYHRGGNIVYTTRPGQPWEGRGLARCTIIQGSTNSVKHPHQDVPMTSDTVARPR